MGIYLTDMADVLRDAGLTVVEIDGWRSRARSSGGYDGGPWCLMVHHTASRGDGAADAHYGCFVSRDRPIMNHDVGRDGTWYVCAAGATNTNGRGGPWTLRDGRVVAENQMNLRAIGIELSNNGVGMEYPPEQIDGLFVGMQALADAYLGGRHDLLCGHVDWAPWRKVDPAVAAAVESGLGWKPSPINASGSWKLDDLIAENMRRAAAAPEEDDMPIALIQAGEGTAQQKSQVFWWDGREIGWVRSPAQIDVGRFTGIYNTPVLTNFSANDVQMMIDSSWYGGPVPEGYRAPPARDHGVS